jgi:hypothetical protein
MEGDSRSEVLVPTCLGYIEGVGQRSRDWHGIADLNGLSYFASSRPMQVMADDVCDGRWMETKLQISKDT